MTLNTRSVTCGSIVAWSFVLLIHTLAWLSVKDIKYTNIKPVKSCVLFYLYHAFLLVAIILTSIGLWLYMEYKDNRAKRPIPLKIIYISVAAILFLIGFIITDILCSVAITKTRKQISW